LKHHVGGGKKRVHERKQKNHKKDCGVKKKVGNGSYRKNKICGYAELWELQTLLERGKGIREIMGPEKSQCINRHKDRTRLAKWWAVKKKRPE